MRPTAVLSAMDVPDRSTTTFRDLLCERERGATLTLTVLLALSSSSSRQLIYLTLR